MNDAIWGLDLITAYVELDAAYRQEQRDAAAAADHTTHGTAPILIEGDQR